MRKFKSTALCLLPFLLLSIVSSAQPLSLRDAVDQGLKNYGTIKAKQNYAAASRALITSARLDYLPNLNLSIQQTYGTVNGQTGPLYSFGSLVSSSGQPLAVQNWNASFGALYLANINWDFFTFGKVRGRIKVTQATAIRDQDDLSQEEFQHEIRVAGAYLNLLAAQRLTLSQQKNLDRAITFKNTTVARASGGLIPGVDSSQANAQVSAARILLTNAKDYEQELSNRLAVLMGVPSSEFALDSAFITRIPTSLLSAVAIDEQQHPVLKYYQSRIELSMRQAKYFNKLYLPNLTAVGVIQGRGSGFQNTYTGSSDHFTQNYADGVRPEFANYLVGIGFNWNLTTIARILPQAKSQRLITKGLQDEYDLADQQVKAQLALSATKIQNALANYNEAPIQVKAATDFYVQKNALYKNGLANILDVTQALYALNRAETDRDIAFSNVWQALLLKSAAAGQASIFMNEF